MNERLARGEEVCSKVHFPLINEMEFKDMEEICNRDFSIDISRDQIDEILQQYSDDFLDIVFECVAVENQTQSRYLESTTQALLDRFDTLEGQMQERTGQLAKCRYDYYLELTHLRNQVYGMKEEGDNFQITEAYW